MIRVTTVKTKGELESFLRFPWKIYHDDPCWVPPYLSQLRKRLDIHQNPFFKYADRELFAAWKNGLLVGTIAAFLNHQHVKQFGDHTGFFGFFETIPEDDVAGELIDAASDWLRPYGIERIRGPINGAPTDEVGVLIDGHDRRPAMWEGHTPPYYQDLLEGLGFEKYDDVFAYEIPLPKLGDGQEALPAKLRRAAQRSLASPDLVIRPTNKEHWNQDITHAHYLYNKAFSTIPFHVDMSIDKFYQMVDSVKPLVDMDLTMIALVDNQPAGFAIVLPDINEALYHFNGEIKRWQIPKLFWYMKHVRTACFKVLGVLPEYRGRGIEALLILEIVNNLIRKRYNRLEVSLASEKNVESNRIIRRMGANMYRQYRIYEREI
jgi:GNAT superfamily N-acetyltransferase